MPDLSELLIRDASLICGQRRDVLIHNRCIAAIEPSIDAPPDTRVVAAAGGTLLPGLNDHHIHLAALATARHSIASGPPEVVDSEQLTETLQRAAAGLGSGDWLRVIAYHESVAGEIDARWLDARVVHCPVRVQHRGGRLWIFNSRALELLAPRRGDPLERDAGRLTGRLYDGDAWLRKRLGGRFPNLAGVSCELAGYGVTGVTDTTPQNNRDSVAHFSGARERGEFKQSLRIMGDASLDGFIDDDARLQIGEHKFHLLESALPEFDACVNAIITSHANNRNVAFHCVTRAELVFALAALRAAQPRAGDRIEHASVTPPELLEQIAQMGLRVVTQPLLVAQRGDQYLRDVAREDQPWLYRLKGFREAGVAVAGSSDAPFGAPNPWRAMQAAVDRRTSAGSRVVAGEALTPEQALELYLSPLAHPGRSERVPVVGQPADLVLMSAPWLRLRANLAGAQVQLTVKSGRIIHQAPIGTSPSG